MFERLADRIRAGLEGYPDDPSALPDEAASEGFACLQRISEAVEAKRLRWLADQDRRASYRADGYLSAAAWLADRFGVAAGTAKREVGVAQALEEMPDVREAFLAGELASGAVRILAEARDEHPEPFAEQEQALVEQAQTKTVDELRRVLACWSGAVDAEGWVEHAEQLRDRRRLDVCSTASGMVKVDGELDPESGEAILTALQALVDAELRTGGAADLRTPTQRRADALVELARRYLDSPERSSVGGERPYLTVTVDVTTLRRWAGQAGTGDEADRRAELDHTGMVHPETARRSACDASLMRVVMAGPSEPLEVGRRTPVVPPHLRRAVVVRDKACRFPGCRRRHPWCDADHVIHWADGGRTVLENLALLCRPHHRLVHEGRFRLEMVEGKPVFFRPDGSAIEEGRAPPAVIQPPTLNSVVPK